MPPATCRKLAYEFSAEDEAPDWKRQHSEITRNLRSGQYAPIEVAPRREQWTAHEWLRDKPEKPVQLVVLNADVLYGRDKKKLENKFKKLVRQWHDDTDLYSSTLRAVAHPSYLRIIAMGEDAIPLVLREMKHGPGHWFPAISALTEDLRADGEDPTRGCSTSSEARAAWVQWGEFRGYLQEETA
jgi:hypothetical protein